MKKYLISKIVETSNLKNSNCGLPAEFGFSHLKEPISSFSANSDILEVGCGSGILLSMLAEEFPQHKFMGVEPFGEGFSSLEELNATVRRLGVNLSIESYEEHQSKYDFIYCVNVFEHVRDWQHFLDWASNNLKKNGKLVFPNYAFPYESHFRIPVTFNKQITLRFSKNIF